MKLCQCFHLLPEKRQIFNAMPSGDEGKNHLFFQLEKVFLEFSISNFPLPLYGCRMHAVKLRKEEGKPEQALALTKCFKVLLCSFWKYLSFSEKFHFGIAKVCAGKLVDVMWRRIETAF